LAYHHIDYQEVQELSSDIPLIQIRVCKSSFNIALVLLQKGELFLPSKFKTFTKLDYHLITAEELNLVQPGGYLVPAPKALGLLGYFSSSLKEYPFVALPLEKGYAILSQQSWNEYCAFQQLTEFKTHQVSWLANPQSNVLSVFSHRVLQRLPSIVEFPPLPASAEQLVALKFNEKPTVDRLIEIINQDPLLSSQIMFWSRSPLYARQRPAQSVSEAIKEILGYELVLNLCLSLTMKRTFDYPQHGHLGWERLSTQAFLTGQLAREIAAQRQLNVNLDYIQLSGLLCDIGYFVLGQYFKPHFKSLLEDLSANPKVDPCIIEFEHFHFTHQHLGAWFLKNWQFPFEIITAVQWHHSLQPTTFCDDYPLSVFLARYFLTQHGFGDEFKVKTEQLDLNINEHQHKLYDNAAIDVINQITKQNARF